MSLSSAGKSRNSYYGTMIGLILETSTDKGLAAIAKNGSIVTSLPLGGGPELSRNLAKEAAALIKPHGTPSFIAIGTGPGSYTGIRVSASLAQALAFGWRIPLFGFCSLEAFIPDHVQPDAVLVDARMGGLYLLKHPRKTAEVLPLNEAEEALRGFSVFASPHPEIIQKRIALPGSWIETSPNPRHLASLSHNLFLQGNHPPIRLTYLLSP